MKLTSLSKSKTTLKVITFTSHNKLSSRRLIDRAMKIRVITTMHLAINTTY